MAKAKKATNGATKRTVNLWSPHDLALLDSLANQLLSAAETVRKLGKTLAAGTANTSKDNGRNDLAEAKKRTIRVWSPQDLKQLRSLAKQGLTAPQAAKKLGRTVGAVYVRASNEKVRFGG
jgi:hypothetical protein